MKKIYLLISAGLLISCSDHSKFQLLSSGRTDINFINTIVETDSANVLINEFIYNGAGVGIADLNNDGLPDIIFAGNQVSLRVYLNLGNFKFKDITSNFSGLTNDQWYCGVAVVDINSDGWPDVYLTSTNNKDPQKRKNRLWVNNGCKNGMDPTFTEMAEKYGIADTGYSVAAAFFDYDRDGYPDLYILNDIFNDKAPTTYRKKIVDGSSINNDRLYHNNGNGTFSDVTIRAGIVYEGYGLGLAIGDVNKDGYPDIYVSNDYIANDLLYINQGNGTFKNEIRKYISYQSRSSMGNDMADVNNDGNLDILTLEMFPEDYYKKKQTINGFGYSYYINEATYDYEQQYVRNMFHLNNGFLNGEMLPYSEIGQMMGIYQTNWSWSPLFADYDNDGDKDLIITTGFFKDLTDKDWSFFKMRNWNFGISGSPQQIMNRDPTVKVPNMAFENTGDLHFVKRTDWLPQIPSYSNGAAFVDLDNDGDLDYVVNNINDEAFILRNYTVERSKGNVNFIKIKLTGKYGNTMAIGAKVELWDGGNYQYTEHFLTRGYASSVDPVIHFGLGKVSVVDSIRVTWPESGYITMLKNIKANQTIEINEKNSGPAPREVKKSGGNDLLFNKGENVINYVHEQTDFIDFIRHKSSLAYQAIIPHKFSQIGPCMAKGDIDGDDREDLIIGSTNKLPTTVFLRRGREFKKAEFAGLTTKKEFSESDLAIVDIDNDGHNDVVAVAGGYENPDESEYKHYLYLNRNGSFVMTELPIPPFPASVVRSCDFNHDGYVDLFVGSRVKKGMYTYANDSWLIINDKGKLKTDSASRLDLGMVTDAIWTDWDHDGWEDLLVVREFDSPVLLKNINGKKLVPQVIPELESHHGIWYSVIAGDFNHDGYDDYILGNLGDNNRFTVSDKYPLNLYVIDIDMDGTLDPLMAAYWPDKNGKMTEYPVNYLDELCAQSSFFQRKFKDYTSFSYAGINDILDENMMKRLEMKLYVNTTSSYILWNKKGKFRWEKLPEKLQVSPINKMIVRDLNGDNWPDVLVSGNDYTYDAATGMYDANKGIVLLNNGTNSKNSQAPFKVLEPPQSGIVLQGMVESLLYFDGDTSLVVAGINRAKATVFEHTKK